MLLQWAISINQELGLTDSHKRVCERDRQKRLSVSLNKAMRTHRGAHVRKLAEIQKKVSTPQPHPVDYKVAGSRLEIGRNA